MVLQRYRDNGDTGCGTSGGDTIQEPGGHTESRVASENQRDAGGEDLTFVLVGLGLDAENGDHHDDDHDGGGGQGHHKPHLAVERLGLEISEL